MKTKIATLLTVTFMLACIINGCEKPTAEFPDDFEITSGAAQFDGDALHFEYDRQTATFVVATETATGQWNATIPTRDLWCVISRQGKEFTVTVAENESIEPRSTHIMFSLGSQSQRIDVHQRGRRLLEFVAGATITISAEAQPVSLALNTNISVADLTVSMETPVGWITSLALNSTNIVFNISEHTSPGQRQATITVSGDNRTTSIVVTQNPKGTITGAHTNVCPENFVLLSIFVEGSNLFQWYKNDEPIEGATGDTYLATEDGVYTVSYGNDGAVSPPHEVTMTLCPAIDPGISLTVGNTVWASVNLDGYRTFAERPDMYTMYYQWNRIIPWATDGNVSSWPTPADPSLVWTVNPCPHSWRLPTRSEAEALGTNTSNNNSWADAGTRGNAVPGIFYGPNHLTCSLPDNMNGCIFLSAGGWRHETSGNLTSQGVIGRYWTTNVSAANNGMAINFNVAGAAANATGVDRGRGQPIRCVKSRE